ncbi:ComF family protein [Nonomuraea cavernae]|uniref:ComF family protein n=1 Tax=Nonomuraea cavernae TaxID=2045107 RepID=UPI0033E05BAE
MLSALLDLLLPQPCVGCGMTGASLCDRCQEDLFADPAPRSPSPRPPGLPECWSAADYVGPVRRAIVSYKERARVTLAAPLADALAFTVASGMAAEMASGLGTGTVSEMGAGMGAGVGAGMASGVAIGVASGMGAGMVAVRPGAGAYTLVPVPSARRTRRARGHDPVGRLAALTAARLGRLGHRAEVRDVLAPARRVADQTGLDAAGRAANLAGSLRLVRPVDGPVVLVDDLVTTGSTLAEAARAVRAGGAPVLFAATVAATRRRSCPGLR